MASDALNRVVRHLRRMAFPRDRIGSPDGDLLACYVTRRDEAAFEALVRRHGPMVLGVCRRILRNEAAAEDAFQATFLILVRKAASIRRRGLVGNWLYGVAHNVARKASAMTRKRRANELAAGRLSKPDVAEELWQHVQALVDAELSHLPDKYRVPIVLCVLEEKTIKEAAAHLGWPQGTVATRLARGRDLLARRLSKHDLALPAAAVASVLSQGVAPARVPAPLADATVRAARLFAAGPVTAGALSANVAALTEGVLSAMFRTKLAVIAALVVGLGLAGVSASALTRRAAADPPAAPQRGKPPTPDAEQAAAPGRETGDQRATRLALGAHAQAAAIDKLARFSYRARYRHGVADPAPPNDVSFDRLAKALTAPVPEKDWIGWYQTDFSWDEKRFLREISPVREVVLKGNISPNYDSRFWTTTDAWARHEAINKSSVNFVRSAGPAMPWKGLILTEYSYLRLTPHQYWWGKAVNVANGHTVSCVPPEKASWKHLGVETFGGEPCDIIDSTQRMQRLWISQSSEHVRGALTYYFGVDPTRAASFYQTDAVQRIAGRTFTSRQEYGAWHEAANEDQLIQLAIAWCEHSPAPIPDKIEPRDLTQFDDYREIAPGVWLPFRETRSFPHWSSTGNNQRVLRRSELRVEEVRTDLDLTDRYARLLPKDGERVQDQRFAVPVDYNYSSGRTDDEIRKTADAEYQERLKGQEVLNRLVQPIEDMVGKPAPALPAEGWVGGRRPDVAGKPYLLYFWATWCGPCKNDLPLLKTLAEWGAIIVGMHPSGTPAEEVEKALRDQQLTYSTFLAAGNQSHASAPKIGDYPAGVFPYYILVDAQGRIAGHGSLSGVLNKFGSGALTPSRKDDAKK